MDNVSCEEALDSVFAIYEVSQTSIPNNLVPSRSAIPANKSWL